MAALDVGSLEINENMMPLLKITEMVEILSNC
jgi:hypothetical protein